MPPAANWRELYPFESHELAIDGQGYHYVDEGEGEPLLMVHGNPTWSFYWRNIITGFRHQYRTIAPDHIGCGLSDKPQRYDYTLAQHTENLCRLIEKLNLRDITLLVHDWGGAIGLGAATRMPDRFARLVIFNTAAFPPPYIPKRIRACRIPIFGRLAIRGGNLFARAALTMAVDKRDSLSPQERAGLLAPYNNWQNRIATLEFVRDIPMSSRHPTYETLSKLEGDLQTLRDVPTMFIWGMRDWCFTEVCLDRLADHLPRHEIHRLDVGHYVVEEARDQIGSLLDTFLKSHPPGRDAGRLRGADESAT